MLYIDLEMPFVSNDEKCKFVRENDVYDRIRYFVVRKLYICGKKVERGEDVSLFTEFCS